MGSATICLHTIPALRMAVAIANDASASVATGTASTAILRAHWQIDIAGAVSAATIVVDGNR
jgi:hypothetical protein